ncbi:hypothetical protein [Dactylosporangium sp. CA-139066]|uniref:hypothetical protein n=1 Tax=Dactylosporangium sp. CA-139066 TaxID=3239930 RepID=UPI003D8A51B4
MARSSVRARFGPDGDQERGDPGWRERRVGRLERDVAVVERTGGWINRAVWGIAFGVMVYGAINVTPLLIEYGVLRWTAPGLPLMVDLAMCIGLWGDRIMHQYGRRSGSVTALRWVTATMTLALNVAGPVLGLDWVGLGIHACGPLLILVVAEAAGSFQRLFAEIVAELQAEIERQRGGIIAESAQASGTVLPSAHPMPSEGGRLVSDQVQQFRDARDEDRRAEVSAVTGLVGDDRLKETNAAAISGMRRGRAAGRDSGSAVGLAEGGTRRDETPDGRPSRTDAAPKGGPSGDETPARDETGPTEPRPRPRRDGRGANETRFRPARQVDGAGGRDLPTEGAAASSLRRGPDGDVQRQMWAHFIACRDAGVPVSAADLDRAAGTNNYARRVVARWIEEGRITEQDRDDARAGRVTAHL